jgi:hypothetical protein
MIPSLVPVKLGAALGVLLAAGAGGWTLNGWRYEALLADAQAAYSDNIKAIADAAEQAAAAQLVRTTQLEQALATEDVQHSQEMSDARAQTDAAKAAVAAPGGGLSVLASCPAGNPGGGHSLPAAATPGGVDHAAAVRVVLDPGVAQRLLALTARGDRALIQLRACQDYVKTIQGAPS